MLRLEMKDRSATLDDFNPRVEMDGEDEIPAADIKVTFRMQSSELEVFSKTLPTEFFNKNSLDLAGDVMVVRDPHIVYPQKRNDEMVGATFLMDFGLGKPMTFADAGVNKFELTPLDGGFADVTCRVQCRPDEMQGGRLYWMQHKHVTIGFIPPELPTMPEGEGKDSKDKKE